MIERTLESEFAKMRGVSEGMVQTHFTPLTVLHAAIFNASKELHELRYELTSGGLQKDLPDILWEHEHLEGLYDTAVEHFDIPARVDKLNARINYHFDFLHTIGEYVRHKHSSRLEGIIIAIIGLELALGIGVAVSSWKQATPQQIPA